MVINGKTLKEFRPITDMRSEKRYFSGVSFGLSEAGYDIRIKQEIEFKSRWFGFKRTVVRWDSSNWRKEEVPGRFILASSREHFQMPPHLMGIVHDKSTWARRGLSVFNTVIEPGWAGFLTLELVYHGKGELLIPAGSGIAQVIFHELTEERPYEGRYQNQANQPVPAIAAL